MPLYPKSSQESRTQPVESDPEEEVVRQPMKRANAFYGKLPESMSMPQGSHPIFKAPRTPPRNTDTSLLGCRSQSVFVDGTIEGDLPPQRTKTL